MGIIKKLDKAAEAARGRKDLPSPPPSYRQVEVTEEDLRDVTSALQKLTFEPKGSNRELPSSDECIAHLKFLTALAQLRQEISEQDGLFGIEDESAALFPLPANGSVPKEHVLIKIREKRWAVYVTRAVDRFYKWWDICVPRYAVGTGHDGHLTMPDMLGGLQVGILKKGRPLSWSEDKMPPLDVLMVLHSFMLNPRDFMEDCIRFCKVPVWFTGMPWALVDKCINSTTFEYSATESARTDFESSTGVSWDNLNDPHVRAFDCVQCRNTVTGPITEPILGHDIDSVFGAGQGFADKSFSLQCPTCQFTFTHDVLRMLKFRKDVEALLKYNIPMPGTIFSSKGLLEDSVGVTSQSHVWDSFFPNWLIQSNMGVKILELTDKSRIQEASLLDVREGIEKAIGDKSVLKDMASKNMKNPRRTRILAGLERLAIRRMMSHYWENSSPFTTDLAGAVLRQGIFVDKMAQLDWIHSPALKSTVTRLIQKYKIFFDIMAEHPGHMAVPTLDVDLAWHTHQLTPAAYYNYSLYRMKDEFIDHNDKVDESALSDGFAWTSKMYHKMTNGQLYSECNCWYCEAIRESTYSRFSSSSSTAKKHALALHDDPSITSDPSANPHISAHNAVETQGSIARRIASHQRVKLDGDYERAAKRAKSKGRTPPRRDEYAYAYAWGYPMYVPIGYYPYAADPCVSGAGTYAYNPSCMTDTTGAVGGCAQGSCGGFSSGGACASGTGACSGGGCGGGGGGAGCGGGGGGGGGGCGGGGC